MNRLFADRPSGPEPWTPLGTSTGSPGIDMALQMLAGPLISSFGKNDIVPLQIFPRHNAYTQLQQWQYQQAGHLGSSGAVQADQDYMTQFFTNIAPMLGDQFKVHGAAERFGQDYGGLMRLMGPVMPGELVSLMHGSRGSAMVATRQLQAAGWHMQDPVTGAQGFTGETLAELATEITENLYATPDDRAAMRKIPVDRMAEMLAVSARRGTGPRGLRSTITQADIDQLGGLGDTRTEDDVRGVVGDRLSGEEIGMLAGEGELPAGLRKIDARRMGDWAKENAGVLNALEEIFGPGQPMELLMDQLQTLTQNNMQGMNAAELEQTVRELQHLASVTGMGIEGIQTLMVASNEVGKMLGISGHEITAARHAAEFSRAYDTAGMGRVPGLDKETMIASDLRLTTQAADSAVARQLGTTLMLGNQGLLKEGTEAHEIYQAMLDGNIRDAKGRLIYKEQDYMDMIGDAVDGDEDARARVIAMATHFQTTTASSDYLRDENLTHLARDAQAPVDIEPMLASFITTRLGAVIPADAKNREEAIAALANAMLNPSEAATESRKGRQEYMEEQVTAALRTMGITMPAKEISVLAETLYSTVNADVKRQGYDELRGAVALHSDQSVEHRARARYMTQLEAEISGKLGGLTGNHPVRNLIDAIHASEGDMDWPELLTAALGATSRDELSQRLGTTFDDLVDQLADMRAIAGNNENWQDGQLIQANEDAMRQGMRTLTDILWGVDGDELEAVVGELATLHGHAGGRERIGGFIVDKDATLVGGNKSQVRDQINLAVGILGKGGHDNAIAAIAAALGVEPAELRAGNFDSATPQELTKASQVIARRQFGARNVNELRQERDAEPAADAQPTAAQPTDGDSASVTPHSAPSAALAPQPSSNTVAAGEQPRIEIPNAITITGTLDIPGLEQKVAVSWAGTWDTHV